MTDREILEVRAIDCRIAPYDWPFARDRADEIAAYWASRRATSPGLFDGRVLLMRDLKAADGVLQCSCFEASYSSFLAWRTWYYPGPPVINAFGMAALQTSDDAYVLGRMAPGTASAGRLYFPAGTPEPADLDREGRLDLEGSVRRELAEETGLREEDVTVSPGWTVVVVPGMAAAMKRIRVKLPYRDLRARLADHNATQDHPELADLVAVRSAADYDEACMPAFMIHFLDWALGQAPRTRVPVRG